MMKTLRNLALILAMVTLSNCNAPVKSEPKDLFGKENLVAWCIVPFDANDRTPLERAKMLNKLGIEQFAYDYRDKHISSFKEEIEVLKEHQIRLSAVWLWVDPANPWNEANQSIFKILEETGTKTELWLGMPDGAFDGLSDPESLKLAEETVRLILEEAKKAGCTLALYNHGGWYGEPGNQMRIIEAVGSDQVKIIYNFHHGHHQVEGFQDLLDQMLPYLSTININGMKIEGPKIITLGEGDKELEMLRAIQNSGYAGPIGILGHTEGEDIEVVLERNLKGLAALQASL
jgi:sugar phosphate isomerase/epimerase